MSNHTGDAYRSVAYDLYTSEVAGQARAALQGPHHVLPDDIKALAVSVLGHRIIVSPAARL